MLQQVNKSIKRYQNEDKNDITANNKEGFNQTKQYFSPRLELNLNKITSPHINNKNNYKLVSRNNNKTIDFDFI